MINRRHIIAVAVILVGLGFPTARSYAQATPFVAPAPNRADEPLADKLSLERAGDFLDNAALAWLKSKKCASCHTTYPFMIARMMMADGDDAPAFKQMRKYLQDRVDAWDMGGKNAGLFEGSEGVTEVVAIAATLSIVNKSHYEPFGHTLKALDRMWSLQQKDGSWTWNKHRLPPQEYDDYFGAVYAALGVSYAPHKYRAGGYAKTDAVKESVARLTDYLKKKPAPNLHHKTFLLWASMRLDGLMSADDRTATVKQLLALQRKDGGWNLRSLGDWKRLNGEANDKDAPSDGYATGLVLFVLREAGVPKRDAAIRHGVRWLETNQRASGRWFTRSVNADRAHYNTVAGTAYAVMALKACNIEEPTAINVAPNARNKDMRVAISPDGATVAAVTLEGRLVVYNVANRQLLAELGGNRAFLRFSPDGATLATPGGQVDRESRNKVKRWNTKTWKEEKPILDHEWKLGTFTFTPRYWDLGLSRRFHVKISDREYQDNLIAVSPDGRSIAVAESQYGSDNNSTRRLRVWTNPDGRSVLDIPSQDSGVDAVAWSPDGKTLATIGLHRLWKDAGNGKPREFLGFESQLRLIALDGKAKEIIKPYATSHGVHLQFSPDAKTLITGNSHEGAVFWNLRNGLDKLTPYARYPERRPACTTGLSLTPDGKFLAIADTSNFIRVHDVEAVLAQPQPKEKYQLEVIAKKSIIDDEMTLGPIRLERTGQQIVIRNDTELAAHTAKARQNPGDKLPDNADYRKEVHAKLLGHLNLTSIDWNRHMLVVIGGGRFRYEKEVVFKTFTVTDDGLTVGWQLKDLGRPGIVTTPRSLALIERFDGPVRFNPDELK